MIHVVFNEIEVALMQEVMQQDESLQGEVSLIRDDFAVGPIADLDSEEGWNARREWWMHKLELAGHNKEPFAQIDDRETVKELCRKLDENSEEQLWIWMGQNQHDVCGYYWLMPQLRAYQGRVMIMYMNNLPCINEKGQLFYPSWLHEIQPREFIKAKILVRPITLSEFEVDPDEWKRLCAENAMVRMLEGGIADFVRIGLFQQQVEQAILAHIGFAVEENLEAGIQEAIVPYLVFQEFGVELEVLENRFVGDKGYVRTVLLPRFRFLVFLNQYAALKFRLFLLALPY